MNGTTTRRYPTIGGLNAVFLLFVLPIAEFVSVYTGYKVHGHTKSIYGYLLTGAGSLSVLLWVTFLVRLWPRSTAGHPAARDNPEATLSSNTNRRGMTQDDRAEELEPTKRRIMEATYEALQKHDYDNLTIQHIADEFGGSRVLLYYHYDGKNELLVNFLDYALTQFLSNLPRRDRTPKEELETLVDTLLPETFSEEVYRLQLSMFELRVDAPHGEGCREGYRHVDTELTELLRDILVRGVEVGEFDVSDPEVEAELFLSILAGTHTRRLTVFKPDESIEPLQAAIQSYIGHVSA